MLTIHTAGGREMMEWSAKAQRDYAPDLLLLGVTVLTSMSAAGLNETGVADAPEQQVLRLGRLAIDSGLRGLVCSPLEIAPLRSALGCINTAPLALRERSYGVAYPVQDPLVNPGR